MSDPRFEESELPAKPDRSLRDRGDRLGELVLLADPHLVLEPDLYRCVRRELGTDFCHAKGKVFLNASIASGSCL